jgi:hypothetical protein
MVDPDNFKPGFVGKIVLLLTQKPGSLYKNFFQNLPDHQTLDYH